MTKKKYVKSNGCTVGNESGDDSIHDLFITYNGYIMLK